MNRRQGGDDRDEEDILRVPIALAAVKLLQQLPKEILDRNLPGIFMKLCSFLKSRLESVRRVTRQTLMKIMLSLGPDYLSYLITEMCGLLTRGFQVRLVLPLWLFCRLRIVVMNWPTVNWPFRDLPEYSLVHERTCHRKDPHLEDKSQKTAIPNKKIL